MWEDSYARAIRDKFTFSKEMLEESSISKRKKRKIKRSNTKEKAKRFLAKLWKSRFVWSVVSFFIGLGLSVYVNPIIFPLLLEKPKLQVEVFESHAVYRNGTDVWGIIWNSRYAEYVVMIQVKGESTPVNDVYVVFDFDAAILTLHEEQIEGVTNPSIEPCAAYVEVRNGEIVVDAKPCELIVDLERLKPDGLCAFAVVIDPEYEGSIFRTHITIVPTSRFFGSYYYNLRGISFKKNVSGDIPTPR